MTLAHSTSLDAGVKLHRTSEVDDRLHRLHHAIEHVAHLLPAQGPITVFIHHNTLHAYEELPFDRAVAAGAAEFGCQPYLTEDNYREKLAAGRIRISDLQAVVCKELESRAGESLFGLGTRLDLRLAMLQHPLRHGPVAELRWFFAETNALHRLRPEASVAARERLVGKARHWVMRDVRPGTTNAGSGTAPDRRLHQMLADVLHHFGESTIESWSPRTWEAFSLHALWRVCHEGVHGLKGGPSLPLKVRHRDLLLEATGTDSDQPVHDLLIRFCAAFLDQGFAPAPLPGRDEGFFRAFCTLYRQSCGPPFTWLRGLQSELARLQDAGFGPAESVLESLELLGVGESEWETFLAPTLLSLRGWAGMVHQIELRGDRVRHPILNDSLVEYLAVQLILERLSLAHAARGSLNFTGPLSELRRTASRRIIRHSGPTVEQRAFLIFQLAQVLGWSPEELYKLRKIEWGALIDEIESFPSLDRRRMFHRAFERRYRVQALDALTIHSQSPGKSPAAPRFQAMFCLDEREESMRRHLEEMAPDAETFGVAGFFNLPIYYRGAADAHYVPLCPVVIRPQHWVAERVAYSLEESGRRRAMTRRALGRASHQVHIGSRTFAAGALVTGCLGVLASIPLVARILFPRVTARIRRTVGRLVAPPPITQLQLERTEPTPGDEGCRLGFTLTEMADSAERLLRDVGLTSRFSRLVLIFGHGSSSMNNPHNSAYNCGACGGSTGGPNARAIAQILNDSRVRSLLSERGLHLPSETVFVGGLHNTCNDVLTYFDLDDLPLSHRGDFEAAREILERVCDRNAHERCRRFESAPLTLSFTEARQHVEERSEDLAQTRPECGHATNALCIVARRERTRGLYLDRRAFLTSYDPTQDDDENSILMRLLGAAFPVCAGINLEYYFSYVDSSGWGCGTKLPHNVTSLLGVM
ncbi:MAG TPA: DUF2309 domain-containing protein, partial [Planctomycetaceae bacterium]|nr:DUF2309 domain-containing protein [Planctomycetaceae bacterium]